jgi:hypothetical protein
VIKDLAQHLDLKKDAKINVVSVVVCASELHCTCIIIHRIHIICYEQNNDDSAAGPIIVSYGLKNIFVTVWDLAGSPGFNTASIETMNMHMKI